MEEGATLACLVLCVARSNIAVMPTTVNKAATIANSLIRTILVLVIAARQ